MSKLGKRLIMAAREARGIKDGIVAVCACGARYPCGECRKADKASRYDIRGLTLDRVTARALVEAGYMDLERYIELFGGLSMDDKAKVVPAKQE